MKALSIRQPWANAILFEGKDVENRTWPTKYRGPILIHAGKSFNGMDFQGYWEMMAIRFDRFDMTKEQFRALPRGGIIGRADIVDCVTESESPWFVGPFGFVLANVKPVQFGPCAGMLGLFEVNDAL